MTLLRLTRPLHLLFIGLAYLLGVSIAEYLGITIDLSLFWIGLVGVLLAQVSMNLLAEVFRPSNEPIVPEETRAERERIRNQALLVSIGALAAAALLAISLFIEGRLIFPVLLLLGLSVILVLAYALPPLRLVSRGFGELILAAHIAYVAPSLGFVMQAGEFHRMLPFVALPVTALALAYFIVIDFPNFAGDLKYERFSLLNRLGWPRAVQLHHGLIIAAFGILLAFPLFGFSWRVVWPAYLTIPFAIFQVIILRNITLGARPVWRLITTSSAILFALTTYLLTFSFFLR